MEPFLIADIGATHARFALAYVGQEHLQWLKVLRCQDYPTLAQACQFYFSHLPVIPKKAYLAVACPILGDWVSMTNHHWEFSIAQLKEELLLDKLSVLNDLEAAALSIPHLSPHEIERVGGGGGQRSGPVVLVAPGSGLGISALIPYPGGWQALSSEGGHMTMAPTTFEEKRILELLEAKYGHVSAERLVSGQGIENIYWAIHHLYGGPLDQTSDTPLRAPDIVGRAQQASCRLSLKTLHVFNHLLGNVAGNAALILGAQGGVYLSGGVLSKLGDLFDHELFREGFEAKGRFANYLQAIPTYLIKNPNPSLVGLRSYLDTYS